MDCGLVAHKCINVGTIKQAAFAARRESAANSQCDAETTRSIAESLEGVRLNPESKQGVDHDENAICLRIDDLIAAHFQRTVVTISVIRD